MSTIKAVSWNVNGLRAALKKGFLDWFAAAQADIVCLQETKAEAEQLPAAVTAMPGYHVLFSSSQVKKGRSGVAIFTREKPLSVRADFGVERFGTEGRILAAEYPHFTLFNIYFPNGRSSAERLRYKMDFYDAFLEHAEGLRARGKRILVCGDINTAHKEIDIARPKENAATSGFLPEERAWMDRWLGKGYVDTFRQFNTAPQQYTWWDMLTRARERNVGWRIDYFIASKELAPCVENAWIEPQVMGSDHCPVGVTLRLPS